MRAYFRTDGAPEAGETPLDSAEIHAWLRDAGQRRSTHTTPDSLGELRARAHGA